MHGRGSWLASLFLPIAVMSSFWSFRIIGQDMRTPAPTSFNIARRRPGIAKGIYPPQDAGAPAFPVDYPHAWLRLKRTGNEFTGFVSTDGKNWKKYGSYSLDLPSTVFLG